MRPLGEAPSPPNPALVVAGSLAANMLLWFALGLGVNRSVVVVSPLELVFDRVEADPKPKPHASAFRRIIPKPPAPVKKTEPVRQVKAPPPPPDSAHNRVLTSKPAPTPSPENHFVAAPGGHAPVGKPIERQSTGNGVANPPVVTQPTVVSSSPPSTKPTNVDTPSAPPPKAPEAKHEDAPPPPPPPKPKGETREAKPDHQEAVEIPENLKSQSFKSFVRVKVTISANGTFEVALRTSSGNADVDKLVLDTLKKWTWKPALKDGQAVDSVQQFRFNFSVE